MKEKLEKLIEEAETIEPQNDESWETNRQNRLKLLTVDLNETIKYLDNCSERELWWNTDLLEELMEHFKSIELINCIERNIRRCNNEETIMFLKQELCYMKNILN